MSLVLFEEALMSTGGSGPHSPRAGRPRLWLRHEGGARAPLPLEQWCGSADAVDRDLLDRVSGPALDVGCGPGRMTTELARRGTIALGVDIAEAAVALTRAAGGLALRRSVMGPLPGQGRWQSVVLADGNVGIGGDPERLLRRLTAMLRPGGALLVELDGPGVASQARRVRLEADPDAIGDWFDWAVVSIDDIELLAAATDLTVRETWTRGGRHFAALTPPAA